MGNAGINVAGGGGSWIKSAVPKTFTVDAATENVSIGAGLIEDYTNCIVIINSIRGVLNGTYAFLNSAMKMKMTSNTNLLVEKDRDESCDFQVACTIIEIDPSAVASFQVFEGDYTMTTNSGEYFDLALTTVDVDKTLAFGHYSGGSNANLDNFEFAWGFRVYSANSVRWECEDSMATLSMSYITWVVELK